MPKENKEIKAPVTQEEPIAISERPAPAMPEPKMPEPAMPAPTIKHHFIAGSIAAGIILAALLVIWVFFKVIPSIFSGGASFVATTLTSTFIPGETGEKNKNTTESDKQKDSGKPSSTSKTVGTTAASTQNYYGNPDLSITIVGTGIIDPISKQFVSTNSIGANNEIAVKFQVRNIGTNVSGPWTLRLNMPSRTTPTYDSYQPSLKPGSGIEYTGSFDYPMNQGLNTGYIIVDPLNAVAESSENNNNLTVQFNISGTSYNYGYGTTYNNGYNYGTNYNNGYYNNSYYYNNGYYNNYPVNYNYGQLYTWTNITVNCYANPQTAMAGTPLTWYATASGGNGYFTYYWVGDDNLYSTNNSVTHVYYYPGNKFATVSVTSGGQTVTKQCGTYIF